MTAPFRNCAALAAAAIVVALVAPPAAASGTCQRDPAWGETRTAWATEVLALTNEHRVSMGLGPLAPSSSLTAAATWKAAHMAGFEYMAHDDPAPPVDRSWDQRIRDCGYSSGAGENIAYGYRSPEAVFQGWLGSAGHRRNIENPSYKVLGVGAAVNDAGTPYWAQIFGLRVQIGDGASLPAPSPPPPPPSPSPSPTPTVEPGSPVARDDSVTLPEDTSARIEPLSNDSGVATLASAGQPLHGTVAIDGGDTVVYVPEPDFHGADSFTYRPLNGPPATVSVTVEPRNDVPLAEDDATTVRPRRSVTVDVVGNDRDADGDSLRVKSIVRTGYYGAVNVEGGSLVYRARRGTAGRFDRITYRVSDGNGGTDTATLEVRIRR